MGRTVKEDGMATRVRREDTLEFDCKSAGVSDSVSSTIRGVHERARRTIRDRSHDVGRREIGPGVGKHATSERRARCSLGERRGRTGQG